MCFTLLASALLVPASLHNSTISRLTAAASEAAQDSSLSGTHVRVRKNETEYPGLDYRYFEVNAYTVDEEGFDDDAFGYELQAAYPLNDMFYARGFLGRAVLDIPSGGATAEQTTTSWGLGAGIRYALRERVDLVAEGIVTGSTKDFEIAGAGSTDSIQTGYVASAGFRWLYRPSWEFHAEGVSSGNEESDSQFGAGAGVRIRVAGGFTVGLSYTSLETTNTISGGLRFGW